MKLLYASGEPEHYVLFGDREYRCDPENPVSFAEAVIARYFDTVRKPNPYDKLDEDQLWEVVIKLTGARWLRNEASGRAVQWLITAETHELLDIVCIAARIYSIKRKETHLP